jgi:hypothetical protein
MAAIGTSAALGTGLPSMKIPLLLMLRLNGRALTNPADSIPGKARTFSIRRR